MGELARLDRVLVDAGIDESERVVEQLLENEERLEEQLSDVAAMADFDARIEAAVLLAVDTDHLASLAKRLEGVVSRAKKRMEGTAAKIKEEILKEMTVEGVQVHEMKDYVAKLRDNPVTVQVDDLAAVARKYRKVPAPVPEWTKWPVDKNAVKSALKSEQVKKIEGVHLAQDVRVEIKPR